MTEKGSRIRITLKQSYMTQEANQLTNSSMFRLDKTISKNIAIIKKLVSEKDESLLSSLVYYICYCHEHDLFGYGWLDPKEFAEQFDLHLPNLLRKVEMPYQFNNMDVAEQETLKLESKKNRRGEVSSFAWDNVIENALYILKERPFSYDIGGVPAENGMFKRTGGMRIITDIAAFRKDGRHVIYRYKLSNDVLINLNSYFVTVDKNTLIRARKRKLEELYLFIVTLKSNLATKGEWRTTVDNTVPMMLLCEKAHIPSHKADGEPYEMRYMKRNLNDCIEYLKAGSPDKPCVPDFEFQWAAQPGQKIAYTPIFIFSEPSRHQDNMQRTAIFKERIMASYIKLFRVISKTENNFEYRSDEKEFYKWFYNPDLDPVEKRNAYENACIDAYKKIPKDINERYEKFKITLLNNPGKDIRILPI